MVHGVHKSILSAPNCSSQEGFVSLGRQGFCALLHGVAGFLLSSRSLDLTADLPLRSLA